jgi:hypothetical protein
LVEKRADGFERGQLDVKNFPGFGKVAHGGILPAMADDFNREEFLPSLTAGGELLRHPREPLVVGADARGQRA